MKKKLKTIKRLNNLETKNKKFKDSKHNFLFFYFGLVMNLKTHFNAIVVFMAIHGFVH